VRSKADKTASLV